MNYSVFVGRILLGILALFFLIFSLDSLFDPLGFFMHNLPTVFILGLLWLSFYRRKWVGYVLIVLGIVFMLWFRAYENPVVLIFVLGIPVVTGILFLMKRV